ncbi:proline dehydrogenase family protein [Niabella insulamsoli]|uniref:proline dehydrogenase family protein n=1 Tax=Niabella insulamsoli TaxID=3144874 RepID=UPI0031FBD028
MSASEISFNNTELAFQYKSDKDLKASKRLFSMMGNPFLVKLGTALTPWAIKAKLPVKGLIKSTIFKQFTGGETLEQTAAVASLLGKYNVDVILDYGVEGGGGSDAEYDHAASAFIRVIDYAASQPNIPFMSVKVTGLTRFSLLEKLDEIMHRRKGSLIKKYLGALEELDAEEREEWHRVRLRMMRVCEKAAEKNVGMLVDAEETWIQDPVDALVMLMMDSFNRGKAVIYNTVQHYRHDRLRFLTDCADAAAERGFMLGVKLVRGAYMEKERNRAEENGYPSPIQADKQATDQDFDAGVAYCLNHIDRISVLIATHNENSNLLAVQQMQQMGLPLNHPHVNFSQLFGMSDNITFNLAQAGCNVSKYLPFGPIEDVIPYLMRRAEENTSVKGQTGRELSLIEKEMRRRKAG